MIDDSSLGQANRESASVHKHKRQRQPASQANNKSSGSEAAVTPSRGSDKQRASLPSENFDIENLKHLDKLQLHDVINRKKEEHERRIKALEKLTKLEKLQAEKLEKILSLNKSNSDTGELSQGDESGCGVGVGGKGSSGASSRRKTVAKEAKKQQEQKKVAHFDMADMTIGDDTMDMANMVERDMWNEERDKKKCGARGNDNFSFNETNDTFMDNLDKSTIDESFGNAGKAMKSSLKKALFESDDSNLTLDQSDIEIARASRASRRVKVVKESQRKNMVGFEEIEEEDEDEEEEDQEEQRDEEQEQEQEEEQDESCDYYTLYRQEKEKSRRSRSSSSRQVAARAISSTPNKSYKEATCSRNQNHKHMERPIAWAYNTENNFPDHAITKLTDSGSREQRLVPATACAAHKELRQPLSLQPPGPKKMSLQEAFETNRYDLISRSRQRQKEIQLRTEQRQLEAEYEIERMAVLQKNLEMSNALHLNQRHNYLCNKKRQQQPAASSQAEAVDHFQRGAYFEISVDKFAQKRAMTQQEIKSMTRRNYSKLPEVKEKQLKKSAEEIKRRNRLKSDLYKKVRLSSHSRLALG